MELELIDKWISVVIIQGPETQVVVEAIQIQVHPSETYQIRSPLITWDKVSNDHKSAQALTTPFGNRHLGTFQSTWEAKLVPRLEFHL